VTAGYNLMVEGIPSAAAPGTLVVDAAATVNLVGIASAAAAGTPVVGAASTIDLEGIPSQAVVGNWTVDGGGAPPSTPGGGYSFGRTFMGLTRAGITGSGGGTPSAPPTSYTGKDD
jgi:hypothetical protein